MKQHEDRLVQNGAQYSLCDSQGSLPWRQAPAQQLGLSPKRAPIPGSYIQQCHIPDLLPEPASSKHHRNTNKATGLWASCCADKGGL